MKSTLGAALFYASEKGWPVLPVWPVDFVNGKARCRCGAPECRDGGKNSRRVGKHPVTQIGTKDIAPRGVLDATTDTRKISEWWKLLPDANIGVRGDKFFALDIDEEDGYYELVEQYGKLPDTIESLSGSGGRHILFKQPAGEILGNEEGDLPRGINVRGNRGYIIVAPSTHQSGGTYTWEVSSHPRDVELAVAPEWLIELIGKPSAKEDIKEIACADEVPSLDSLDSLDLHSSIIDKIKSAPDGSEDRSAMDQKVIVGLLSVGLSPAQIKAIFSHYPIGTQGKYAERGDEYLDRSIARGVSYVGPINNKKENASVIVPGKRITQHEARLERRALDVAYLKGWHDALQANPNLAQEMWPHHIGISKTIIDLYELGMRTDITIDGIDGKFSALVVPYKNAGELANIGYDLQGTGNGEPDRMWESAADSHVFETDIDGAPVKNSVLVTEDWDTAIYTYLNYGHTFPWLSVLGFPDMEASDTNSRMYLMQRLADTLADSERILLAWPTSRQKDGIRLASMLEDGNKRVQWVSMPRNMKDMYRKYGLNATYLNRYIQKASPIH